MVSNNEIINLKGVILMEYLKPIYMHEDYEIDERIKVLKRIIISEVNVAANEYQDSIDNIESDILDLSKIYDNVNEDELRSRIYYTILSNYYLNLQNIKILYLDSIGECDSKDYFLLIMDTVFKEGEKVGNMDAISRYYK